MSSRQQLVCLLAAFAVCDPAAQMLDQIRSRTPATAVWWTGNAGWLIRSGDLVIGIDDCGCHAICSSELRQGEMFTIR